MDTPVIDFVPWGLEGTWPSRYWLEPISGRRDRPARGVRLGHASETAMVLVCTYPRDLFDEELTTPDADPVREFAYETTFTLINLALHQIRVPGARPEGLVGSLLQFAGQQAYRHREWAAAHWGPEPARTIGLAGWQSGFSLAYPGAYVAVHACGTGLDQLQLVPAHDLSGYEASSDPLRPGAMHWELWRSEPAIGYEDLARVVVAR